VLTSQSRLSSFRISPSRLFPSFFSFLRSVAVVTVTWDRPYSGLVRLNPPPFMIVVSVPTSRFVCSTLDGFFFFLLSACFLTRSCRFAAVGTSSDPVLPQSLHLSASSFLWNFQLVFTHGEFLSDFPCPSPSFFRVCCVSENVVMHSLLTPGLS